VYVAEGGISTKGQKIRGLLACKARRGADKRGIGTILGT
jgi:hypothetical protein